MSGSFLKTLVQEIVTEHKRLFITNGVFPVISIDENFRVATDVKWMKFVIGQFITNAVKYTFDEGKKVHLTATCTEDGLQLTIRDEGDRHSIFGFETRYKSVFHR